MNNMKKEHVKLVVWPKQKGEKDAFNGPNGKIYRYVIIGMIVTDEPIKTLDGVNEVVFEGYSGISEILKINNYRELNYKVGDATDVLLNLEYI